MRKLDIVAEEKERISRKKKWCRDEIHWFNFHRARVLRKRNSCRLLSGNFESVCSRREIHGPITPAYYYADYTVTRISSLSRLHLEQLALSTSKPVSSDRLRPRKKKKREKIEGTGMRSWWRHRRATRSASRIASVFGLNVYEWTE